MNNKIQFRPQSFSVKPFPNETGGFSLKSNKQKFEVTNITLEGYKLFLGNNTDNVLNVQAIPINEIECMMCDDRVHPYYYEVK